MTKLDNTKGIVVINQYDATFILLRFLNEYLTDLNYKFTALFTTKTHQIKYDINIVIRNSRKCVFGFW